MFVPVQQRVLSPCFMSRLVSGDRKRFKTKVKKSDYSPICVELNAFHSGRWSRCLRARHFGVDGTQSNGLILGFVFPPSGIWCQFSEGFGPNCGWNVDHHSVHLSGQPRPYKNNLFSERWNISPACLFKKCCDNQRGVKEETTNASIGRRAPSYWSLSVFFTLSFIFGPITTPAAVFLSDTVVLISQENDLGAVHIL